MERRICKPDGWEANCEAIYKDIQKNLYFIDRILKNVHAVDEIDALGGTKSAIIAARGLLREAHEDLHQQAHGCGSGKWRTQRDIAIEKRMTGQRES